MTEVVWSVRVDRRAVAVELIHEELQGLALSIEGLTLEVVPEAELRELPDLGGFRDFVVVASLSAPDVRILQAVGDELLAEFGFAVDWKEDAVKG